ncbi:decapping and exoribonuclease protein [Gopherus flavomarginatus]|uniref:decapping and exoribonuclease protein n=1 Tax=Gopherus flavomarginatus TaxID=286002 RepID=UPI0021CBCCFC|nr:decapping and exoribonuclease protein [Gopherus flavomarginatus]
MEPSTRPAKRSSGAAEAPLEPGGSPKRGRWAPLTLPVEPALYDGPFPFYRRPAEEGHFSLDTQRRYHPDARQLRYFAPPPAERPEPPFDLRHGYRDRYVRRDEGRREGLEHILQWVAGNRDRLRAQGDAAGRPVNADFVTWRGHLTKVLTTPYESQEGWLLAVSLFRGTLYVSEVETPAARQQREQRSDMLQELAFMGYKFERYMCADTPDGSPDPTGVVNTNEAFCTVVRTRLGSHSLLFAGEVDCTDPHGAWPKPPACYVELKTCKELHSPTQRRSFYRHKLIKWWAQSFLPGVSRIVAGFRAPDGSVAALETFETMKIFQLIRGDRGCWKPAVCMNFCEAFLAFLKRVVTEDDPQLVHLFAWEPGSPVSYTRHRAAEHVVLPARYVETMSGGKRPD